MAQLIETHYDHLQVMRTAPLEVIKASYRVLSQKYHPDRNPDPDALHIIKRVNQAWDVLSNPERRAKYDRWIADNERQFAPFAPAKASPEANSAAKSRKHASTTRQGADAGRSLILDLRKYGFRLPVLIVIALAVLVGSVQLYKAVTWQADELDVAGENAAASASGPPAPSERLPHGSIATEPQSAPAGTASIEIDNVVGYKDAEVRLYRDGRRVRSLFVHRGLSFFVGDLAPGAYVLKYRFAVFDTLRAYQASAVFILKNADVAGGATQVVIPRASLFSKT